MPASFVYFIAAGETRIKIGRSADPARRLRGLQTGSSEKLTLLGFVEGGVSEERSLHNRFANHRIDGEWFAFAEEIWIEIDRLLAGGAISLCEKSWAKPHRSEIANPLLDEISNRVCAYFKAQYPTATGKHVAAATGLKREAVEKMLATKSGMSARSLHACLEAFGPTFLAACVPDRLRPDWIDRAVRNEQRERLECQLAELEALRAAL